MISWLVLCCGSLFPKSTREHESFFEASLCECESDGMCRFLKRFGGRIAHTPRSSGDFQPVGLMIGEIPAELFKRVDGAINVRLGKGEGGPTGSCKSGRRRMPR